MSKAITASGHNKPSTIEKETFVFPASRAQQQLWLINEMNPESSAYNIPFAFEVNGPLDIEAFRNSINEIIKRHETFRTVFSLQDNKLVQIVSSELTIEIPLLESVEQNKLQKYINKFAVMPFDLSKGPLIRSEVIKSNESSFIILLNFHHIILDHTSIMFFGKELHALYLSFSSGKPVTLPEPNLQYPDFVLWQNDRPQVESTNKKLQYWKENLKGEILNLELPVKSTRPAALKYKGAEIHFSINESETSKLKDLAKKERVSLFVLILSVYKIILSKYSNLNDIIVGCPFANRTQEGSEEVLGCLMNTLPLRTIIEENDELIDVIRKVRITTLNAQANQEVSFGQIVEEIQPSREAGFNPYFQVSFIFQEAPLEIQLGFLNINSLKIHNQSSKFDLTVWMWDDGNNLNGILEYSTELFSLDFAGRFINNFVNLLNTLSLQTNTQVSHLDFINEIEKDYLVNKINDKFTSLPSLSVYETIENQCLINSLKTAIIFKNQKFTYSELLNYSNNLAHQISVDTGGKKEIIGIYLDRSAELPAVILGILKSGCAFLPLDPSFPEERLQFMVEDSGISKIITSKKKPANFANMSYVFIEDISKEQNKSFSKINIKNEDLAYILYTSGSTGKPKGVQLSHLSLKNFLFSMNNEPGIKSEDVLLAITTISFDISLLELLLPIYSGATVVVASKQTAMDGRLLIEEIEKNKVNYLQATPATLRMLIETGWIPGEKMTVLAGGEALPKDLAAKLLANNCILWNMYGPTETCIWSSIKRIEKKNEKITIGRPIANTSMYILDKDLNLLPVDVPGELFIGGHGVSLGYLNRTDLTTERFINNPFSEGKLYRTGDLAKVLSDGDFEHLGRTDFQVKIRGFRIELEEIEQILNKHECISQAVVCSVKGTDNQNQLAAFIKLKDNEEFKQSSVKKFLKEYLPEYMVPNFFSIVDEFPMTPNGKIDRKKLQASIIENESNLTENSIVEPYNEIQSRMVKLWKESLHVTNISIRDNFFELGGHSLMAARLFAKIEEEFKIRLPLALLFQAPTIEELSLQLEKFNSGKNWDSIVPINNKGSKPPLFLIHGAEGNVLLYRELSKYLGSDYPVYGIQSQGLDGKSDFEADFEIIAQKYIEEIKNLQPEGPYYLGGYCLGGTIALEIAIQLKAAGDEIGMLAMFETYNIHHNIAALKFPYTVIHKYENILFHINNFFTAPEKTKTLFLKNKFNTSLLRFRIKLNKIQSSVYSKLKIKPKSEYPHFEVEKLNDAAQLKYIPKKYDGHIDLFKPVDYFKGFEDKQFGWGDIAVNGVKIHELKVFPKGMMNEPYVKNLADQIKLNY